jgi:hypothetical protein
MRNFRSIGLALIMAALIASPAMGDVITYQEGSVKLNGIEQDESYSHLMADIRSEDASANRGGDDRNVVGYLGSQGDMRIVMDFALDHIPADATIQSVSLSIIMPPSGSSDIGSGIFDVNLFEVIAEMAETEVTWNNRAESTTWDTAGGDFDDTTILSTVNINKDTDGDATKTFASSGDFVEAAQNALDDGHNFRLILIADSADIAGDEYLRILSDDQGSLANRPSLQVGFIPEPATMSLLAAGGLLFLRRRGRN